MTLPVYQSLEQINHATGTCVLIQRLSGHDHATRRAEAHALLRALVARRRGVAVEQISLRHTPGLPPQLPGSMPGHPAPVSISYADDLVALAWSPHGAIGIDLVPIALPPEWRELAALYFPPARRAMLAELPKAERPLAFSRCWAELEARGKCCALGLQEWSADYASALSRATIHWLNAPEGMVLCLAQKK